MNNTRKPPVIVEASVGVTLAGGGRFSAAMLARARALAPRLVAADGGADRLLAHGAEPEAVIGDMDSISASAKARLGDRLHPIPEQLTTDFDKALRSISAPYVLALGFAGQRLDHSLAVLSSLVAHPDRRCLVISPTDVTFLCPPDLTLTLPLRSRFSLYPLGPVTGESEGLRWPIGGIDFGPDAMIGTSNEVSAPVVRLKMDQPRMLVILPRRATEAAIAGLTGARGG